MSRRNVYGLLLIVTLAWVLVLAESYIFIAVIRPLGPPLHEADIPSSLLKILLTVCLGVLWISVMFAFDWVFSRWRRTTPPS